jgi:hypothetical protein
MLHKFNKMVKSKAECEWTIYEKESNNSGAAVIDVEATNDRRHVPVCVPIRDPLTPQKM